MTREKAADILEEILRLNPRLGQKDHPAIEAMKVALTALRPVSRERVEKVWRGEWNQDEHGRVVCNRCGSMAAIGTENALHNAKKYDRFCFYCGAPMTDEAVDMVMERLNKMEEMKK